MIKSNIFTLNDFSGGLNTKSGTMQIPLNYSSNCLNVISNLYKSLQVRNGMDNINSATAGATAVGYGLYSFPFWSGGSLIEQQIAFWDTTVKKMDALDGIFDSLTPAVANTATLVDATVYSSTTANYFIYTCAGMTGFQVYTGSGNPTSLNTDTITASKNVISWKKHLWCLYTKEGGTTYPYRLRRTDVNTYGSAAGDWTGGVSGYDDIITNDGDYGTGFAVLRGMLYVFKRYSIFRISYLGGSPLIEIRQVASIGTDAFRTIKNITLVNGDEVLMFLGSDNRIYMFNGYNAPQPISELISEDNGISIYSLPKIDKTYRLNACAENYDKKHWYVLFFTLTGSVTNNAGYLVDYYSMPFSIFQISGWNASSTKVIKDSNGESNLYFTGYDGFLYKADTGNNDNGSAINAFYESSKITPDKVPLLKKAQQVEVLSKAVGNYTYNFGYRTNFTSSYTTSTLNQLGDGYTLGTGSANPFTLGTSTLGGSENIIKYFDIPQLFNFIQFKISDNSSNPRFNLYEIDLIGNKEGLSEA